MFYFRKSILTLTAKEFLFRNHVLLPTSQLLINIKSVSHYILSGNWTHDSCREVLYALDRATILTDTYSKCWLGMGILTAA
jgi:hypothetical protein